MSKLSLDEYLELARKSKLVPAEQLAEARAEFLQLGGAAENAEGFGDFLRGKGWLTAWQSQKLLSRKYKGFFVGKHKLLERIGTGGMGRVYLAEHVSLHRRAAIKILPQSRVKDPALVNRFQLEARALARLDHKNIVKVYDVDREGDVHYIVMEFVSGQDLESLVAQRGPLSGTRAAHYIGQAAAGLAHAHSRSLIHRDVKPSNLLLGRANTIKLLDLGLARLEGEDASLTAQFSDRALGTTDYISPEQAVDSHAVDVRTDIYSLGCTFYFLLTGHPPFHQGSIASRLLAHQTQEPPPIARERARVGAPPIAPELIAICGQMMAKDPADRYQDAKEVFDVISSWLDHRRLSLGLSRHRLAGGSFAAANARGSERHEGRAAVVTDSSSDELILDRDLAARETSVSQAAVPTVVARRFGFVLRPSTSAESAGSADPPATSLPTMRQVPWVWAAATAAAVVLVASLALLLLL